MIFTPIIIIIILAVKLLGGLSVWTESNWKPSQLSLERFQFTHRLTNLFYHGSADDTYTGADADADADTDTDDDEISHQIIGETGFTVQCTNVDADD